MDKKAALPLRVVCATRERERQFFTHTLTGASLKMCEQVTPFELRLHAENTTGLSELYNLAIQEAEEDPCILVFIHDDISIRDFHWGRRIREGLDDYQVVGLAGNIRSVPFQPSWFFERIHEGSLLADDDKYLSGSVGHPTGEDGLVEVSHYGPTGQTCKLLDGLLLAAHSEELLLSNLRFDEQFKFHFYDVDFCKAAENQGVTMGTIPLAVTHASVGAYDERWAKTYAEYVTKWR